MFMFKLAGHLGMTVHDLSLNMSSAELSEWYAYDQLDPISVSERLELMHASLTALTANVNRRKGKKAYTTKDFLPRYKKYEQPKQTPGQMKQLLLGLVNATKKGK